MTPNGAPPIIRAEHLGKTYRVAKRRGGMLGAIRSLVSGDVIDVRAVEDVSFAIQPAEIVGYVGPNGAGKSTTIKMLTGILVPTAGAATVCGLSPQRNRKEVARRIGVVFGQRTQLWWDLPLVDSLDLLRHIYRVPPERFRRNLAGFVEMLDMAPFLATPVRQLSLGQRMRGELAAALLHDPEIIYLDEPTIGLDVVAKHRIRDFLRTTNRVHGVTVLLTTHDMSDIEQLCSRLMIIDHGRLLYDGGLGEIRARFGGERTLVVDLDDVSLDDAPLEVGAAREIKADGPRRWLRFSRSQTTAAEVLSAVAQRYRVRDLTIEEPDVETIVRRIYEEGLDS